MHASEQSDALEQRGRTRRNILAIGSILGGALLSGCKPDSLLNQDPQIVTNSSKQRHHADGSQKPNCFLRGTGVLTPEGERRIEDIQIGDSILTVEAGVKSVRWIGRRRFSRLPNEAWKDELKPIRITRGALGSQIPKADLFVSQGHRLCVDGVLISAADLVNRTSIVVDDYNNSMELEYLHVMTDGHALILSEAAASETLLADPRIMKSFDNYTEFEGLYGGIIDETDQPCAPVYADRGRRARVYSHLRNALSPWVDRRNQLDRVRDRLMSGSLTLRYPIV